ncbi:hypothetical protein evm_011985 [Chilo suppressalis]|nr:hypothetical protein evm_011985 [Chilo suppressalis]
MGYLQCEEVALPCSLRLGKFRCGHQGHGSITVFASKTDMSCGDFQANFDMKSVIGAWHVVAILPGPLFPDKEVSCYKVEFSETDEAGLRWLVNRTLDSIEATRDIRGTIIRQRYHSEHDLDVWSKAIEGVNGCFQQVLSMDSESNDIRFINVLTAGAQAFSMDGIGRLGHDPPRGPSADWRVLTTADAAGTNGLTCLPKHGGTRDRIFGHPSNDRPLRKWLSNSYLNRTIAASPPAVDNRLRLRFHQRCARMHSEGCVCKEPIESLHLPRLGQHSSGGNGSAELDFCAYKTSEGWVRGMCTRDVLRGM